MSDFNVLRSQVEDAAKTLAEAEAERHRQNEALTGLLSQLESRFDAQQQELEYYKARVRPLEQMNEQLAGLIDRLLAMIDQGFGEASVAPLRDAALHASRILEQDLCGSASTAGAADETAAMPAECPDAAEDVLAVEAESDEGVYFENVGEIELLAEAEVESEEGAALPYLVAAAHQAAAEDAEEDDVIAELVEAIGDGGDGLDGGDSPETAEAAKVESMDSLVEQLAAETAGRGGRKADPLDIRSLLNRVEAAVEEVRAHTEPTDYETNEAGEQRSAVA